jgi:uncharacterized protein YfaS (alpha-2-macroglobulin family)
MARFGFGLPSLAVLVFAGLASGAWAQNITILDKTDLPGGDYNILKNVELDACTAACEADNICQAFTFNSKSKWCFLKSEASTPVEFSGAISGIRNGGVAADVEAARLAELPFPAEDLIYSAKNFASELPTTDAPPANYAYAELLAMGDDAWTNGNLAGAILAYRQALALNSNDRVVWQALAQVSLLQAEAVAGRSSGDNSYDLGRVASYAALNSFLRSSAEEDRGNALSVLAYSLQYSSQWREAIATFRTSLKLVQNDVVAAQLEKLVAEHGFRIVDHVVDADGASPNICVNFSEPLPKASTDISAYVVLSNTPEAAIETRSEQICIEGVAHGARYDLRLRKGLPAASGEALAKDVDLSIYVPDRAPFVGFANNAYVMPAGLGGGLPITSVNAESASAQIYRIGDRSIASAVREGTFRGTLSQYNAQDIADQSGELIWSGEVDLAQGEANALVNTAIPVSEAIGQLQPGAYVITAKIEDEDDEYWRDMATQWFIVTDLGLTTVSGDDGVHAFVRSLTDAKPVAGSKLRLVAVNNEILGEAVTDAEGRAVFAPGLARGTGGRAPQLLVAETDGGDYAFLDLSRTAFDLTDRGVEGRPSPGPLDVFATTERGVYRPGETVYLTAFLRDDRAKAVTGLPLTLEVERPDGVVATKEVLKDQGAGGYYTALPMVAEAMRGSWTARLYADPKAEALSSINFLVEDFEPERLSFDLTAPEGPMEPGVTTQIDAVAKYLYGATAPGLSIEADAITRPLRTLSAFPGYRFGREDDTVETSREPLGLVGVTDEAGNAIAEVSLPTPQVSTQLYEAQILLRLVDTNGRTVERSVTRPVLADGSRLGIKPVFADASGLAEGAKAEFEVIAVSPDGKTTAETGLSWSLARISTTYQWYRDGSAWRWEPVTDEREIASGTTDISADKPAVIGANVDWGRYRITVNGANTSASYEFYAGYYYADAGSDTPDTLRVALDKPAYRVGETAQLKLEPQFSGQALVMVVDNRVIAMKAVDVPAEGITVPLEITDEWGPGAYVSAVLYRPSDVVQKRMPARALGLAYADVDPGDRKLDIGLSAPEVNLPRQSVTVDVAIANVQPGETAYVAVAAVDLGILNLTNFKVPDPDGWYFGQRQLGMDFRDLYGSLIDPTQGLLGALRVGGDGGGSRLGTPPPTTVLVAQHSGIVKVGADGKASVTFDMPDFAGTVRIMAMAWTDTAIGHASTDIIVRDPVVVNLSPPRFLRVGDSSRLLVEVNNVDGQSGSYGLAFDTGLGINAESPVAEVALEKGERTSVDVALTGAQIGDWPIGLNITAPDGTTQVKTLTLGVRPMSAPQTTSRLIRIPAGDDITVQPNIFDSYMANTSTMTLAIGPLSRLDVPGLLLALDRYPYGCTEQTTSRALPLLYLNDVAKMIGTTGDEALSDQVVRAIASVLSKQNSGGGFGLWGPFDGSDLWLDSYVTDFLLRAKAAGYDVPEQSLTRALDNVSNQLSYASDFERGGEDVAYALYDLAKAGRASMGDLRYYYEARLDAFASPLAKAQLGAALALYGDSTRSNAAFAAAAEALKAAEPSGYRKDYGSRLRDLAGVLALAGEFKPTTVDLTDLANQLGKLRDGKRYTSTQEDSWTLLAAAAITASTGEGSVTVDGSAKTGQVYLTYDQAGFAPIVIGNTASSDTEAKVTVTGYPEVAPEANEAGFGLSRDYYTADGEPVDLTSIEVKQNDRFLVVLTVRADQLGSGEYLVADPLPAGFEIENPDLSAGGGANDYSWLDLSAPAHVESRTDQFVAAFRYGSDPGTFTTAYMVRAVSPGSFVLPGATVEDMYRPEYRANLGSGSLEILPN